MINVWSYLKEYENEKEEILKAIIKVLESGQLILGPNVSEFESEFSKYCGQKFGIGVANGTDAIFLALKAFSIGEDDEVITVSNTAVPTVSAITATGARAVFVDINPLTYLMDVEQIKSKITNKTKVIIAVHLYGQCVDMNLVNKIAHDFNLKVIEDCAQSHGAKFKGNQAGSFSDISTFSFYPTKILGTFGDGGLCATSSSKLESKLRKLRFYGMEKSYYSLEQGYNSRLDELHAAILLKKLKHLDEYVARRREIASRYNSELGGTSLILPHEDVDCEHAYYAYVVRHSERDKIIRELTEKGINVNISYPWPIHTMPAFDYLGFAEGSLPESEKAATEIFSLPMYPTLSDSEQEEVVNILKSIV